MNQHKANIATNDSAHYNQLGEICPEAECIGCHPYLMHGTMMFEGFKVEDVVGGIGCEVFGYLGEAKMLIGVFPSWELAELTAAALNYYRNI